MNPAPDDWSARAKDRPRRRATDEEAALAYAYHEARGTEARAKSDHKRIRCELLERVGDTYMLDLPCGGSVKFTSHQHRQVKVEDLREE